MDEIKRKNCVNCQWIMYRNKLKSRTEYSPVAEEIRLAWWMFRPYGWGNEAKILFSLLLSSISDYTVSFIYLFIYFVASSFTHYEMLPL